MRHLDLFSGIGGFSLGLESTGHFETVAFCEIEEFPRKVLRKHWPDVPCYEDVRDVGAERLVADGIGRIDIVTGGFPCQDISLAGNREGLSGERSGLWSELFRVITQVQPRWAIVENVPGLRTLGADAVLADLAGAGYSAWPLVVGAVHAGASHRRQRVWIVAKAKRVERGQEHCACGDEGGDGVSQRQESAGWPGEPSQSGIATDAHRTGLQGSGRTRQGRRQLAAASHPGWDWSQAPEPVLRGMDDGLPCGMDRRKRLTALGNAVVPQIVAAIGRAIIAAENPS